MLELNEHIGNLGGQMAQSNIQTSQSQTHVDQQLQHRLAAWLGIPDPSTNYQAALQRRHPETGLWLINGRQFEEWKNSDSSLMWLYGDAGCGKTILSAVALQEVLRLQDSQPDTAVGYFYFDFTDTDKQSSKKAIRSLLCQVASHTSDSLQVLQQLYQRCGNGQQQPSDNAIQLVLNDTLTSLGSIYIVSDALDECTDREDFVTFLCCLVDLKLPGLRMLSTSRRERDIEEQLRPITTANINIQSAIVDEDICLYVQSRLRTDAKLRKWPGAVRNEISSVLTEKANGMFRWVYCQLETIRHCIKLQALREALSSLPKTLDETYERILQDLDSRGQLQDAITTLRWLCFSPRLLRLSEVVEVLAIKTGDSGGFSPDERLPDPMDVMVVCSSLISYHSVADKDYDNDSESGEVEDDTGSNDTPAQVIMIRLAHFSVKEYLLSDRCTLRSQFQTSISHQLIAEGCLLYLLYMAEQGPLTEAIVFEHPLARYTAEYWWQHAHHVRDVDHQVVVRLASRLLTSADASLLLWVQLYSPERPWRGTDTSLTLADVAPALYYAALVGLPDVVGAVLDHGADIHAQGGEYGNALQAASHGGHEKVVQMLLDAGADVHAQGGDYGNALQAASYNGDEKVVQMLLDAGADVHAHGGYYGSALQAASYNGDEKVVQMLLDVGADVHAHGGDYGNALQAASVGGHEKVVQVLLDTGADVHAHGGYYGNALQAASYNGHEKVVQMLLDAGADVHAQGGGYNNALQAASVGGHEKVVQMLLDAGADVHARGGLYGNALRAASVGGHEKVVKMLLDVGADVHAHGGKYGNAL